MTTEPRRPDRVDHARLLVGLVAVVLLGLLLWSDYASRDQAEQAETEKVNLAQQVSSTCEGGGPAARELEAIGACDRATEAAAGGAAGETPPVGIATDGQVRTYVDEYLRDNPPRDGRAPTVAEVESAVTRVCQDIGCEGSAGPSGPPGEPGANATDEQVAAQVASWCAAHNDCVPTEEEISAAVAAYCGATPSPCAGPQGAQGEPGVQGPPGPLLTVYYETTGPVTRRCELQEPIQPEQPHYVCRPSRPPN